MSKLIKKIGVAKFKVSTPNHTEVLELDFNPIIEQFKLQQGRQDYKLIHWQGRPKDPKSDTYRCGVFEVHPTMYGASRLLMLDDATVTTIPSAVVHFVGSLPIHHSEGGQIA